MRNMRLATSPQVNDKLGACGSLCPYMSVSPIPESYRREAWCSKVRPERKLARLGDSATMYVRECPDEELSYGAEEQ